ncbi:hypothetical protein SAMN04488071_0119 [Kordiimonas lacus]|jgi:TPR repeat protein|uniref:SPOR domain-containing protein n=2 Tax=Kordiimonadaceae TaxID=1331809 RepID=A0A1G6T5F9_9PROT|nr:hypothetical protein SAMN04488071_0119 [Kordiimonas lacus]
MLRTWLVACLVLGFLSGYGLKVHALQDAASAAGQTDDDQLGDGIRNALELIRQDQVGAAIDMLRRLGELGNAEAFFHLAEIHRIGVGREPAPRIALMYYRLGAQMGSKQAALNLANILFFEGDRDQASVQEAMAIWQQYALLGDVEAMYLLGMVYWNGEGGLVPDPIRGYGLVWRAASTDYDPATETEPAMRQQLQDEAVKAAQDYAENLETKGFDRTPLDLHLVTDAEIDLPEDSPASRKPENWDAVWRLEVGFAMGEEETRELEKEILAKKADTVGDLYHEIIEAPNRPGLFRLLFGPIGGMQDAVKRCVSLKRSGYDCFAKPPS